MKRLVIRESSFLRKPWVLSIFLLASLLTLSRAENPLVRVFTIPNHGALDFNVPKDWKDEVRRPPNDLPPTIKFIVPNQKIKVLVTALWNKNEEPMTIEKVKDFVQAQGDKMLSTSLETSIDLIRIKGKNIEGYYYAVQDKSPNPGEFKCATQGSALTGNLILSFTILSMEKESLDYLAALDLIRSAQQKR